MSKTYVLTPAEILTLTVGEPCVMKIETNPDEAQVFDRKEAQTIEGLRKEIANLNQVIYAQRRTLAQYGEHG
jgi:hypothetical protein